jgi:hypothetical protein
MHGYCKCLDLPFAFKKTFQDKIQCSGVWVENQTLKSLSFTIEPSSTLLLSHFTEHPARDS